MFSLFVTWCTSVILFVVFFSVFESTVYGHFRHHWIRVRSIRWYVLKHFCYLINSAYSLSLCLGDGGILIISDGSWESHRYLCFIIFQISFIANFFIIHGYISPLISLGARYDIVMLLSKDQWLYCRVALLYESPLNALGWINV